MENKKLDKLVACVDAFREMWANLDPATMERCRHFSMRVYLPTGEKKLPMLTIGASSDHVDQCMDEMSTIALGFFDAAIAGVDSSDVICLRNTEGVQQAIAVGIFPFIDDGLMYLAIDGEFVL